MLPVWAIRRSLTIRRIRVVAAETDVLFLPVIGVMTDRLAAGLLIRQWWERMGEQRHPPPQTLEAGVFTPNLLVEIMVGTVFANLPILELIQILGHFGNDVTQL